MQNRKVINAAFITIILGLATLLIISNRASQPKTAIQSPTITPQNTAIILSTPLPTTAQTDTTEPTVTFTPLANTPTPTSTQPAALPESFYIRDILGNRQYYALGCEASAAVDLAWYHGVHIYQYDFQYALPLSDNPDIGFVGDVNGPWGQIPPYAYGVHAGPVANLLNQLGVEVEGGKGYTLEDIKAALAASKPVIVWVIGRMEYSNPVLYTDSKGVTSIVAPYEHVVILTGYDKESVRYLNNGRFADVPNETFLTSWGVLGNMAVFHK